MMEIQLKWDDRGQVLVQVALGLVVLLLMVGLAIDGGNVYGERRAMQNAADAGALAGARAICTGNPDPVEAEGIAIHYAQELNGADEAVVDPIDVAEGIVRVTASKEVDTFLMGLAGGRFDTVTVAADAAARCGLARAGGGVVPIAFDVETWDGDIDCDDDSGDAFVVWGDKNANMRSNFDLSANCNCEPLESVLTGVEGWNGNISAGLGGNPFDPGDRGWLSLGAPPEPLAENYPGGSCGASGASVWMREGHPGPIGKGDCVTTEPGVVNSILPDADTRVGDTVGVILYDLNPCSKEPVGGCPGDELNVAGIGCVKVVKVYEGSAQNRLTLDDKDPDDDISCPDKDRAILVIKVCGDDCYTVGGRGSDEPADPERMRAVSLIE